MPYNYENAGFWDGHFNRTIREGQEELVRQRIAAKEAREHEQKRWYSGDHEDDGLRLSQIVDKYGLMLQPFNFGFTSVREMKIEAGKAIASAERFGSICNSKMDGNLYLASIPISLILYKSQIVPNLPGNSGLKKLSLGGPLEGSDALPIVLVRDQLFYMLDEKENSLIGEYNKGTRFIKVKLLFPSRISRVDPLENL